MYYKRYIDNGSPLLSEEEINEYFTGGSEKKVQEVIFNSDKNNANIVILNLGTGSFLDVVTRHGSLTIPNIFGSVTRDIYGISSILELIQDNNRINNLNTQVYLCCAPRIVNTAITDIFMNPKIKKVGKMFANLIYVPSFPRQAFYKAPNGAILPDPHYNIAEYYHFLSEIEQEVIDSYFITDLVIDLDRELFRISTENDTGVANHTIDDVMDIIDSSAKAYEAKTGDYNYYLNHVKPYIREVYPFTYFRASTNRNIAKELKKLEKHIHI